MLGLRCFVWAFSSCSNQGLLSGCGVQVSHYGDFSCCKAQALRTQASAVVAQVLNGSGA